MSSIYVTSLSFRFQFQISKSYMLNEGHKKPPSTNTELHYSIETTSNVWVHYYFLWDYLIIIISVFILTYILSIVCDTAKLSLYIWLKKKSIIKGYQILKGIQLHHYYAINV